MQGGAMRPSTIKQKAPHYLCIAWICMLLLFMKLTVYSFCIFIMKVRFQNHLQTAMKQNTEEREEFVLM